MVRNKRSVAVTRWVKRNTDKHLCKCCCGEYIIVKRRHANPKNSIPKFIVGHNLQIELEEVIQIVERKSSFWDKLSPEERERRLSQLNPFGSGEDNPSWKGGRRIDDAGYVQIRMSEHPFAKDGYIYEHRLVVEERTRTEDPDNVSLVEINGIKYLNRICVVHHIDEVRTNNTSSNLMLLKSQRFHAFIHGSPLPMEERLRRIEMGICHSGPIGQEK